jgi:hypothetical protein
LMLKAMGLLASKNAVTGDLSGPAPAPCSGTGALA